MTTIQKSSPWLLALAIVAFAAFRPYQATLDKITVREFEMVDTQGVRRASIKVEDGGNAVFWLLDQQGAIRVKLAGNAQGSGLVLLDENTEPAVHVLAKKYRATITLTTKGNTRDL